MKREKTIPAMMLGLAMSVCLILTIAANAIAVPPNWTPITATQYNMVALGSLYVDGVRVTNANYTVGAFGPGGESDCRAVEDTATDGSYYLTIVGDVNGQALTFKVYDKIRDMVLDVQETATFSDGSSALEGAALHAVAPAKPVVNAVTLSPASPVKAGTVTFTIVFDKPMDTTVEPVVTFGEPAKTITRTSYGGSSWVGQYAIEAGYDGPQTISISGGQDLSGNAMDADASHTFTVDTVMPVTTASPAGGTFNSAQSVTLSANEEATIYFTLDGSEPTEASNVYSEPIYVADDKILKFFAMDSAGNHEAVKVRRYIILSSGWVSIDSGYWHSVSLKSDGSLLAWGANAYGQLGNGTTIDKHIPTRVGTDLDWKAIAAGWSHTVALKSDGSLWTWGWNSDGQLGDGTTTDKHIPTRIGMDLDWTAIAAGRSHTVALKSDGSLWAWGFNSDGQLGDGTTTDKHIPTRIGTDLDWKAIAAGDIYTLALKSDGSLWSWGFNGSGQLGDGTTTSKHIPTRMGTDSDWTAIAAGGDHAIALKSDGSLWSWGSNSAGQLGLGDGETINKNIPTRIGMDTEWVAIEARFYNTLALKSDYSLWTWGSNYFGQLGDGETINKNIPTRIGMDTEWVAIDASSSHTLALKANGSLWSWGYNYFGQLGNGSTENSTTPQQLKSILTITKSGSGAGTVTASTGDLSWSGNVGTAFYDFNTPVTLSVISDSEYMFGGWLGACTGTSPTCDLVLDTSKSVTATFVDVIPPSGSLSINSGAAQTNNAIVTLTLSAFDASDVTEMMIDNDDSFNDAIAETFASAKSWTLSSSEGSKTVYVKFKDSAGNWSSVYTVTVTLDTTAPVTTASPGGGTYNAAQSVTLTANEAAVIYYTTDGSEPTAASSAYGGAIPVANTTTLKFFARDAAGNAEAVRSQTYTIQSYRWTPITATQYNMVALGALYVDGIRVTNANYTVGSFGPGGESDCRAVEDTAADGSYYLTIVGDVNGQALTFKVYDKIRDMVLDVQETGTFSDGSNALEGAALHAVAPAKPVVSSVTLSPAGPVKAGTVTFTIVFDKAMDTAVAPVVTFGEPAKTVVQTSYSGSTWVGQYDVATGYDGQQTINISGGQELTGLAMDADTSHVFVVDTTSPATTASPGGGTYNTAQNVTLTASEQAVLYYTTDGSEPTTTSSVYGGAISITNTTTLKFFAKDAAGNAEAVQAQVYIIDAAGPTGSIDVNGGATSTNNGSITLTVNAADASGVSQMQFSNDGASWSAAEGYADAKSWSLPAGDGLKTVYVRFRDSAGNWSSVYTVTVTLDTTAPVTTASPGGGTYNSGQSVTLTANESAVIYYTTDGSEPTAASSAYEGPIPIAGTTTLRFFAKDGAGNAGAVQAQNYTLVQAGGLQAVGPTSMANGFPVWYEDTNGLRLEACLDQNGFCMAMPPAAGPVVYPTNFPEEFFYWSAAATLDDSLVSTTPAALVLALEGAFANGPVVSGDQVVFARIRFRFTPAVTGNYTITHPFGQITVAGTAGVVATATQDIGLVPGFFTAALANGIAGGIVNADGRSIGPFLTPASPPFMVVDPVSGNTYLANPGTPIQVTGSPLGTNFFRIAGPGGTATQTLFALEGKVSGCLPTNVAPTAAPDLGITTSGQPVIINLTANDPAGTVPVNSASISVTVPPANGTVAKNSDGTVTYTPSPTFFGQDSFSYTVQDICGLTSNVMVVPVTVTTDATAPVTTASPEGGTYNSAQSVTLTAGEAAVIYYTTDGSEPTTASNVYGGAISIANITTLKFFARDAVGNAEAVQTQNYYIVAADKSAISGRVSVNFAGYGDLGVRNATVSLQGTSYSAPTDADGNFILQNLPVGSYTLVVTAPNMDTRLQNVSLTGGNHLQVTVPAMTIAGANSVQGDANGDKRLGLEDVIYLLQILTRLRQ